MSTSQPFDFVKAINYGNASSELKSRVDDEYVPFLTNRSLSYFADSVFQVNEINRFPDTEKSLQFEFLLNTVRPGKRFAGKWPKTAKVEDIETVQEYYGYGFKESIEALKVLTPEQLKIIKRRLDKGG